MSKKLGKRNSSVFEEAPSVVEASEASSSKTSTTAWYNKPMTTLTSTTTPTPALLKKVTEDAEKRYLDACKRHQESLQMTRSDREWFIEVTKKGTLNDKLAAYAMAIQEGPLYSMDHLKKVLEFAGSENRHENLGAAEAMTDILVGNDFLPKARKLYYLHQRPLASADEDTLVHWYFEDQLKTIFFSFLKLLEKMLQDTVEYNRERATRFLFDLLMACPLEQQANTLNLMANKLGDPHKKLSSRIIFYLEQYIQKYPREAVSVVNAIKEVITRPSVPERAQYYGLTLFTQLYFAPSEPELVTAVMSVYTVFFKSVVVPMIVEMNKKSSKNKKKKPMEEQEPPRLAKVILSGINRALPFLPAGHADTKKVIGDMLEPLLKLCKMANINTAILALSLFHSLSNLSDSALHRNILFNQLADLVGEWMRLSKYSNSYGHLFLLLDKIVDANGKTDGKLERLVKRVVNSACHLDTLFAIRALLWLHRSIGKEMRLRALISMPPESVDDVRETCLFELVSLSKHFDPVVSSLALSILNNQPIGDNLAVQSVDESIHRRFMLEVTELESKSLSSQSLIAAMKAANTKSTKSKEPKQKKSKLSEDDLDESGEDFDDLLEDEDDLISESDGSDGSDGIDDGDFVSEGDELESEFESEDGEFESEPELSSEVEYE